MPRTLAAVIATGAARPVFAPSRLLREADRSVPKIRACSRDSITEAELPLGTASHGTERRGHRTGESRSVRGVKRSILTDVVR